MNKHLLNLTGGNLQVSADTNLVYQSRGMYITLNLVYQSRGMYITLNLTDGGLQCYPEYNTSAFQATDSFGEMAPGVPCVRL